MSAPADSPPLRRSRRWVQLAATALALAATVFLVGARPLLARVRGLDLDWVAVGLLITAVQFPLLATRWWFVALRLGLPLSFRRALGEYYLSTLLNNFLPLGGDALRAFRHADRAKIGAERPFVRVVSAILLERASGQLAVFLTVLVVAPGLLQEISLKTGSVVFERSLVAIVVVGLGAAWVFGRRWLGRFYSAAAAGGRVLLLPSNLLVHLPLSLALVATHVALFIVGARSIGLELGFETGIRVVPPVLLAASVPVFVGGFGMREAAAAGLYHLMGLGAADGAAISFAYGSIALLGSLPGVVTLAWRHRHARAHLSHAGRP
jgi:glycosyltransferase 2 family protein